MRKRRIAYGLGLTVVGLAGLVAVEGTVARRRAYASAELGLALRGEIGSRAAPALRLVLMGDSTAVGVGVDRFEDTVGGQLAELLAAEGRRVHVSSVAVSGAKTTELDTQVARALMGTRPDVAVMLIGSQDATSTRRLGPTLPPLGMAVEQLGRAGVPTVVGTCPDLGAARAFAQPLRAILAWRGRGLAQAQAETVHAAGGTPVDLAGETGVLFRADPGSLCWDRYHPSADGYRLWAHALAPAVRAALPSAPTHKTTQD